MHPKCPICARATAQAEPEFLPFCGERCKWIDLGRWLDGDYRIAGEQVSPGAGFLGVDEHEN